MSDLLVWGVYAMMTSWHGNAFHTTGLLWRELTQRSPVHHPHKGPVIWSFDVSWLSVPTSWWNNSGAAGLIIFHDSNVILLYHYNLRIMSDSSNELFWDGVQIFPIGIHFKSDQPRDICLLTNTVGPLFTKKTSFYWYMDFHFKPETVVSRGLEYFKTPRVLWLCGCGCACVCVCVWGGWGGGGGGGGGLMQR